jgi:hypothetical protein
MISLSLMGQHDIKELKKQRHVKKHHNSFSALEKKMSRSPEYASRQLSIQYSAIQRTSLKADQATDQTMDSILWEIYDTINSKWVLSDRELFVYDGAGNMIHYRWYAYDSLEMKILPQEKEDVQYNAQGRPTEILFYEWDKISGQWVYVFKFELTYDGEGNLIQETVYEWDPDGSQWLVGLQFDMTYDGSGNLLEELWSFWDEDSSKLIQVFKDEYIYEGGKLTTWNEYMWEEGNWEKTYNTTYTYDLQGNLILEFTQGWDFFTEDWGDFSKIEYTYVGDKVVTEIVWGFDWMSFTMVLQTRFEYTWDADGNMITEVESSWDEGAGAVKSWNDVAGSWQNTWKSEWTFNKNFTILDLYVPYWFTADLADLTFWHMPVSETGYFNNNGTWDLNYRQTAYYSDFGGSTSIEDVLETPVSVFPNPASETVTFNWDEKYTRLNLELYDLTGKRLISRSIDNNETISVDDLSRGMYLYKLTDNIDFIQTGKISLR